MFIINFILVDIVITRNPSDTSVCLGNVASMSCGFSGADPHITIPEWIRIVTNPDGTTTNITISSSELMAHSYPGHLWEADLISGTYNAPGSRLLIGPVDQGYDRSVYVCRFSTINGIVKSSPGILTVISEF